MLEYTLVAYRQWLKDNDLKDGDVVLIYNPEYDVDERYNVRNNGLYWYGDNKEIEDEKLLYIMNCGELLDEYKEITLEEATKKCFDNDDVYVKHKNGDEYVKIIGLEKLIHLENGEVIWAFELSDYQYYVKEEF